MTSFLPYINRKRKTFSRKMRYLTILMWAAFIFDPKLKLYKRVHYQYTKRSSEILLHCCHIYHVVTAKPCHRLKQAAILLRWEYFLSQDIFLLIFYQWLEEKRHDLRPHLDRCMSFRLRCMTYFRSSRSYFTLKDEKLRNAEWLSL